MYLQGMDNVWMPFADWVLQDEMYKMGGQSAIWHMTGWMGRPWDWTKQETINELDRRVALRIKSHNDAAELSSTGTRS